MKSQFIYDQPEPEYRAAIPTVSQTFLKNILAKSPAHALESSNNHIDTAAMKLGRAVHCIVLEGEKTFHSRYAIAPDCDRRTKDGKATYSTFLEISGGKETLSNDEQQTILAIAVALKTNGLTKHLFTNGKPEVSAFGQINGVDIKGRYDYYFPDEQIIIDLKTCLDASPEAIKNTVLNTVLNTVCIYSNTFIQNCIKTSLAIHPMILYLSLSKSLHHLVLRSFD